MDDSIILYLYARDVPADTPPLPGTIAYIDLPDPPDVAPTVSILPDARHLLDGMSISVDEDSAGTVGYADRYELSTMRMPLEAAHATGTITPIGGTSAVIELRTPGWLSDDARRGALTAWRLLCDPDA